MLTCLTLNVIYIFRKQGWNVFCVVWNEIRMEFNWIKQYVYVGRKVEWKKQAKNAAKLPLLS